MLIFEVKNFLSDLISLYVSENKLFPPDARDKCIEILEKISQSKKQLRYKAEKFGHVVHEESNILVVKEKQSALTSPQSFFPPPIVTTQEQMPILTKVASCTPLLSEKRRNGKKSRK